MPEPSITTPFLTTRSYGIVRSSHPGPMGHARRRRRIVLRCSGRREAGTHRGWRAVGTARLRPAKSHCGAGAGAARSPPAACPDLAAPAPAPQWLLAGRSRAVPTARHPRCVPASRRPLQRSTIRRRRRAWPIGPGWEERTMPYDLVVKNGVVIDGSGMPRYRADVGVRHGRIVTIGRIRERAREVIDADGQVVAPGFVDGHTHMDAQVFWDPLGTCSCWHGVTTVVM